MKDVAEDLRNRVETAYSMPHIAPAYPELPFHICADVTMLTYPMDRDVYEALVPEPLQPAPEPTCQVWSLDFFRASGLGPYRELAFVLEARMDGREYVFSPYMILNELPGLLVGREMFGVPKVMADEVTYTERNKEIMWTYRQGDSELVSLTMTGDEWVYDLEELPLEDEVNRVHRKTIPSVEADQPPAIDRLVTIEEKDLECEWAMKGRGQVNFNGTADNPVHLFEPAGTMDEAFRLNIEFNVYPGEVLHVYEEYTPPQKRESSQEPALT